MSDFINNKQKNALAVILQVNEEDILNILSTNEELKEGKYNGYLVYYFMDNQYNFNVELYFSEDNGDTKIELYEISNEGIIRSISEDEFIEKEVLIKNLEN